MTTSTLCIHLLLPLIFVAILARGNQKDSLMNDFEITFKISGVQTPCVSQAIDVLRKCERLPTKDEFSEIMSRLDAITKIVDYNSERLSMIMEGTTVVQIGEGETLGYAEPLIQELQENPHNCKDIFYLGDRISGVRKVYPFACCANLSISVYCDQSTDGGGWTVFQQRDAFFHREDFFRTWEEYQRGFGNLTGEFWLGLDNIYALTSSKPMELRVDLEDFEGDKRWAKYDSFSIDDAAGKYRLHVGGYSGNAGDFLNYHNEMMFSTKDNDNDNYDDRCAKERHGAWWYNSCHHSNLNGFPYEGKHETISDGINVYQFRGHQYSLKKTAMKLRPKA